MGIEYGIFIDDASGNRLVTPGDWQVLDYTRAENDSGPLTLQLPGDYDSSLFVKDGLIEVWRSVDGATPYLDTETVWLIRRKTWTKPSPQTPAYWTLYAWDLNSLIRLPRMDRRIVDYAPGTTTSPGSVKVTYADNMGKAIMRENFGSLATDTTRVMPNLSVQANFSLAPIIYKEFARASVLKTLQDIALTSYQNGTYLVFDIVCAVPPGSGGALSFEFRSYTGQRGIDHTFPNGNPPLLIGPDYNNLDNVTYDYDATGEVTRGIAIGPGFGISQAVARENDTARQGESPYGLTEGLTNATSAPDASTLTAAADSELRSGIPRKTLSGKVVGTSGLQYGVDWKWGDLLTAQVKGDSFNAHASRVHVHVERDTGDQIDAVLQGVVS